VPDVPFSPWTPPTHGDTGWDTAVNTAMAGIAARINNLEGALGVPLDSFTGVSDDAKLAAAMSYAAAQTYPPPILLGRRAHTFTSGPYNLYNGFRLIGSPVTGEREFSSTGPQTVATISSTSFLTVPSGGVKNGTIRGIQFRASSGTVDWLTQVSDLASGPIINDFDFWDLAWVGFRTIMRARHLRCSIERTYINNGTQTQFYLGGSDNYYWMTGRSYMSSTALPVSQYYLRFGSMSDTKVGPMYITPQVATGVRIDGGAGDLQFWGTRFDCTGRNSSTGCQGAALYITAGTGHQFHDCWFFNNAVNPSGTGRGDKGQVWITGGNEILFENCAWSGGATRTGMATPSGTPAIYAASGASGVKVVSPMAPASGTKLLQHQTSGVISKYAADDWTLSVA
jgi:hypothetical protein